MTDIHNILNQFWGFNSFRPLQQEVIESILAKKDTLALMPTGGGKSLCYQVPALVTDGLCLVISPLIALMKDQVENLRKKNITAFAIYSGMSRKEVVNTLQVVVDSNCKFLYVSPERLETSLFKEYLPGMHVTLIAVDEAHCISQWGYDFRPPYLRIALLREELPGVPVLALTASATAEVQNDICEKLTSPLTPLHIQREGQTTNIENSIANWKIYRQSFERANLSYSVFHIDSKINKITEILTKVPGSSIVYCKSRKRTKEIAELLQLQHISSDYYHAGLSQDDRNRKQEAWIRNKTRVIVCTNAFGMGIDKPDVRSVIHADVPDCLENYYQEAGRAGRDGKTSFAVLLFDEEDISDLEGMAETRYPSLYDIRKVYQSLANYLQIPAGSGSGNFYDFDLNDFIKKFKLNIHTAVYGLKTLAQDGWLSYNEQVFLPAQVRFTTNRRDLEDFEKTLPHLDSAIKSLLRAYEGIFDFPCSVSELLLVTLMKKPVEEVKSDLQQLHQLGIIEYRPQKDSAQILLLQNRIQADDLSIDMTSFLKRKENFKNRVAEIIHYVNETIKCRSQVIGHYFGDDEIKKCGICDNCLRQKKLVLSKEEFSSISALIKTLLQPQPLPTKELILTMGNIKKEKAWKVIDFLQAENEIEMDKAGWVRLK
ncbi:MAG TPA: ATP-dependent DNA helicase RecQ, partial [Chitinophagaceae bacterium]|nr:ATP-dependent DNA helicase RecQ [Chitinophagaceae bacterium]